MRYNTMEMKEKIHIFEDAYLNGSKLYIDVISNHVFEYDSKSNIRSLKIKIHKYLRKFFGKDIEIKTKFTVKKFILDTYYSCLINLELIYPSKADLFDLDGFRNIDCLKVKKYDITITGEACLNEYIE